MYYEKYEKLKKEKGVKDRQVAIATGIDPSTFTHWKKNLYTPKNDKLIKIANYFGVDIDYFIKTEKKFFGIF